MTSESASIAAIIVAAIALLASLVYLLVRGVTIQSRVKRISNSPAAVAAAKLPALGERISAGVQQLQSSGERLDDLVEQVTAARDAGGRLRSGIDSVAACVVDLLDTFAPSARGSAS